jgi:hypothetical protein
MSIIQEQYSYLMLAILKQNEPRDISTVFLQLNGNETELEKLAELVAQADYSILYDTTCGPIEIAVVYFDYDNVFTKNEVHKLCLTHIPTLDHRSNLFTYLDGKFKFDFTMKDIDEMSGKDAAIYLDSILGGGGIYNYWKAV